MKCNQSCPGIELVIAVSISCDDNHYTTGLFNQDGNQDSSSPPYSPDLASCGFCLFPKLRGGRCETIEDIKEAMERYYKCIAAVGDYFEGDYSFMYVLSIKLPIRKSLETCLMILVLFCSPQVFQISMNSFFHMNLSNSKSPHVSRNLLSSVTDL